MAKTPPKKGSAGTPKKAPVPRKSGAAAFNAGMKALDDAGVPTHEFGRLNKNGTHVIDSKKIEDLKTKLGNNAAWSRVRFVALNAPFKRRVQIPPA